MSKRQKSRWTVLRNDLILSQRDARWGLGIGVMLFIAAIMHYQTMLGPAKNVTRIPTLYDYTLFVFAGCPPFDNDSGAPFPLPITWFAVIFFCIHSCAFFPFNMMRGMGTERLLQTEKRVVWWLRMSGLVVFWCALYMITGILGIVTMGILRFGICQIGNLSVGTIGMLFLALCVLSELQAICSALFSPPVGELALTALIIYTAFYDYPALWPHYTMLLRSELTEPQGFSINTGLFYLTLSLMILIALGAILFQRTDILSHNKDR